MGREVHLKKTRIPAEHLQRGQQIEVRSGCAFTVTGLEWDDKHRVVTAIAAGRRWHFRFWEEVTVCWLEG